MEKKNDFTASLVEITKAEIKKVELTRPLVFCFKNNTIGIISYDCFGSDINKILDNISIQIRTFVRSFHDYAIGVIFEGTTQVGSERSDLMTLEIEDGLTVKGISYILDKYRNIVDVIENSFSVVDCPVARFQNFFRTDYVYNNHIVCKKLNQNLIVTEYETDVLNTVKYIATIAEKNIPLSFVLYKKRKSNKLFSSILDYGYSTHDIDLYFNNRKNEMVSWIKTYCLIDTNTFMRKEFISIVNHDVKAQKGSTDLYEINYDRSLTLKAMNLGRNMNINEQL